MGSIIKTQKIEEGENWKGWMERHSRQIVRLEMIPQLYLFSDKIFEHAAERPHLFTNTRKQSQPGHMR